MPTRLLFDELTLLPGGIAGSLPGLLGAEDGPQQLGFGLAPCLHVAGIRNGRTRRLELQKKQLARLRACPSSQASRAPPGRTLLQHRWLFRPSGVQGVTASPRQVWGMSPNGKGGKVGRIVPMRREVGARGRTRLGWGGRHHSESDSSCAGRRDRRPSGSRCDGVSPSGLGVGARGR